MKTFIVYQGYICHSGNCNVLVNYHMEDVYDVEGELVSVVEYGAYLRENYYRTKLEAVEMLLQDKSMQLKTEDDVKEQFRLKLHVMVAEKERLYQLGIVYRIKEFFRELIEWSRDE